MKKKWNFPFGIRSPKSVSYSGDELGREPKPDPDSDSDLDPCSDPGPFPSRCWFHPRTQDGERAWAEGCGGVDAYGGRAGDCRNTSTIHRNGCSSSVFAAAMSVLRRGRALLRGRGRGVQGRDGEGPRHHPPRRHQAGPSPLRPYQALHEPWPPLRFLHPRPVRLLGSSFLSSSHFALFPFLFVWLMPMFLFPSVYGDDSLVCVCVRNFWLLAPIWCKIMGIRTYFLVGVGGVIDGGKWLFWRGRVKIGHSFVIDKANLGKSGIFFLQLKQAQLL